VLKEPPHRINTARLHIFRLRRWLFLSGVLRHYRLRRSDVLWHCLFGYSKIRFSR
jgi:hypothetical protein